MIRPGDFLGLRPSSREIASAYMRIANIYRRGALPALALDYYRLVISRFPEHVDLSIRARLHAAQCLAASGNVTDAHRHLLALLVDSRARPVLAGRAALELFRLARLYPAQPLSPWQRLWVRQQVWNRLPHTQFLRWHRFARSFEPRVLARGLRLESGG
jgi:hypothetical protein